MRQRIQLTNYEVSLTFYAFCCFHSALLSQIDGSCKATLYKLKLNLTLTLNGKRETLNVVPPSSLSYCRYYLKPCLKDNRKREPNRSSFLPIVFSLGIEAKCTYEEVGSKPCLQRSLHAGFLKFSRSRNSGIPF